MKYKAALFDMDGVILDSEPLHVAAFQTTLQGFGYTLDLDGYEAHFAGRTDEEGFRQYFAFINEEVDISTVMNEKAKQYMALASDQLLPYPGITQIINELSLSVPLALVTGSLRAEVDIALKACGLEDVFSSIVTAEDVTKGKPAPEGYLKAATELGVAAHDCVVVEDSPKGVAAAIAAGIDCIAITTTHSRDDLKAATKVVDTLSFSLF